MTRTGPKAVPVELAKRRGNPGKRSLPEPIRLGPLDAVPDAPADLGPVEQAAWVAVAGPLVEAGALQSLHLVMLRQLAVAVGLAERARAALEDEDLAVPGARGGLVLNPKLRAWRDCVGLVARLAAEFGATPSSLTQIGLSQLRGKSLQQELADRYEKT